MVMQAFRQSLPVHQAAGSHRRLRSPRQVHQLHRALLAGLEAHGGAARRCSGACRALPRGRSPARALVSAEVVVRADLDGPVGRVGAPRRVRVRRPGLSSVLAVVGDAVRRASYGAHQQGGAGQRQQRHLRRGSTTGCARASARPRATPSACKARVASTMPASGANQKLPDSSLPCAQPWNTAKPPTSTADAAVGRRARDASSKPSTDKELATMGSTAAAPHRPCPATHRPAAYVGKRQGRNPHAPRRERAAAARGQHGNQMVHASQRMQQALQQAAGCMRVQRAVAAMASVCRNAACRRTAGTSSSQRRPGHAAPAWRGQNVTAPAWRGQNVTAPAWRQPERHCAGLARPERHCAGSARPERHRAGLALGGTRTR